MEMSGNYFTDYQEPNSWDEDFEALKNAYLNTAQRVSAMVPVDCNVGNTADKLRMLDECISLETQAMANIVNVDDSEEIVEGMMISL